MYKSKLIAEQIKKIRPLIKESSPQQKLKLMKLMKVALKEGFNERQALIQKLASTGDYDVSDLELASDEELEQLLADENQQGVAEGSEEKDNLIWTLNSFGYYSDNSSVYVNDDGDKIVRVGSEWKHQSGKRGRGPEELGNFLSSIQGVAEGEVNEVTKQSAIKQYQDIQNYKVKPSPKQDEKEFIKININRPKKAGVNESTDYVDEK